MFLNCFLHYVGSNNAKIIPELLDIRAEYLGGIRKMNSRIVDKIINLLQNEQLPCK